MTYEHRLVTHLLPMAHTPAAARSILEWRPFAGGDSLGELIDAHNAACIRYYEQVGWLPEQIETLVEIISVLQHDLATASTLRVAAFRTIRILMIDLAAVAAWWAAVGDDRLSKELGALRFRMSQNEHLYYLCEVNPSDSVPTCRPHFASMPVLPVPCAGEEQFREFLHRYSNLYWTALQSCPPPPAVQARRNSALGRAVSDYVSAFPDIAATVRDAAMMDHLSNEDTVALTRKVASQEFALSRLKERMRVDTGQRVAVDAIRQPLFNALLGSAVRTPLVETNADLLRIQLVQPLYALTREQRELALGLGVRGPRTAVVHFNLPETQDAIGRLGKAVRSTEFVVPLPIAGKLAPGFTHEKPWAERDGGFHDRLASPVLRGTSAAKP